MEINDEGGYAAAVVCLMAKDRLLFQTEVPQQVIVLDPNLAMVDEQYVRILQRYKELLRNAGNMDEEDIKVKLQSMFYHSHFKKTYFFRFSWNPLFRSWKATSQEKHPKSQSPFARPVPMKLSKRLPV